MRKKNSICEFTSQRNESLLRNFRASLAAQSRISVRRAFLNAVNAPAPRFWVTEARATRVISMLLKGVDLTEGMLPEKKKMYMEILGRVKQRLAVEPHTPLGDIVFDVVNSPAPCAYLTPETARKILK